MNKQELIKRGSRPLATSTVNNMPVFRQAQLNSNRILRN